MEKAKPSPDVFVAAADRLHVAIDNCIVVGDSVWDLLAAVRKSALGVGFLSGGYGQEELERAGAFRVYSDAADMLMHIEQLGLPGKQIQLSAVRENLYSKRPPGLQKFLDASATAFQLSSKRR